MRDFPGSVKIAEPMTGDRNERPPGDVTVLLGRMAAGDDDAGGELFRLLKVELHALASRSMRAQRVGHTLQATALVNEAWLRLARREGAPIENHRHFIGVAAKAMRSVLVDHARRGGAVKRNGRAEPVLTQELVDAYASRAFDLVELDDALGRLSDQEPRMARIVDLRFFAGLTIAQTAEALSLSTATVERDWHLARVWLRQELGAA